MSDIAEQLEELGLNTARQEDNGANPRPDNRSGWLAGEAPARVEDDLVDHQDEAPFWDPSRQLRHRPKPAPQSSGPTLETLSSRALLREVARRQARKVRRHPPD